MIYQVNLIQRTIEGPFNSVEEARDNLNGKYSSITFTIMRQCLQGKPYTNFNVTWVSESYKNSLSNEDFWKEMAKRDTAEIERIRGLFYCKRCDKEKAIAEKYESSSDCIQCDSEAEQAYRATESGYINHLLSSCKQRAENRLTKGRTNAGVFTLTFEQVKT